MIATAMKMDLRKLHEVLQTEEGRRHFTSHYPEEMGWYERALKNRSGNSMVQAVLMAMWQQEMERDDGSFCERLAAQS